jgi:hypothetical protein
VFKSATLSREVPHAVAELPALRDGRYSNVLATSLASVLTTCGIILLVGCSNRSIDIVDGLKEGMSEAATLQELQVAPSNAKILHESVVTKSKERPEYSEKTISIANARCSGVNSEIWLSFFDRGLREVTCYPTNVAAMLESLKRSKVIDGDAPEFNEQRDGTTIRGGEVNGRWGVSFQSDRLTDQQEKWVKEYS